MRLAYALALGASLLWSGATWADRWQLQPNVRLQTNFSDNVRFVREDKESGFFADLDANLRATRSTEASDTGIYLGLGGSRYPSDSDLDNERGYAGLDLGYRLERQRFGLATRFDSLPTLYSETATTGLTQINYQQNSWSITPSWAYNLTERSAISLAGSFQDVRYDIPSDVPLSDYQVWSVKLGGGYRLTERLDLNAILDYGHYEASRVTNTYDNVGIVIGMEYRQSERSSLSAQIGLRRTEQTFGGFDDRDLTDESSGYVYALSYYRDFEAGGGLRLQARRELSPSGSAQILDTTALLLDVSRPLSARWGLGIGADAYRNRQPNGRQSLDDRTYASIAPRLSYSLSEQWVLSAGYRFRWEEREELAGDITANGAFLALNWARPWDL